MLVRVASANDENGIIGHPARALFVVAESDGELIGMLTMVFGFSTWMGKTVVTVEDVYVRQDMRGLGIATALLDHAFKLAKDMGCARVDLVTEIDNYPAQELYKKAGFLPVPRIPFTRPV